MIITLYKSNLIASDRDMYSLREYYFDPVKTGRIVLHSLYNSSLGFELDEHDYGSYDMSYVVADFYPALLSVKK